MEDSRHYLYYPYINFRDETWLKKMALYADSVTRIVPEKYPTMHSVTLDTMVRENYVRELPPSAGGKTPSKQFSRFVLKYRDELKPKYGVDKKDQWYSDLEDAHVRKERKSKKAYVEASKLAGADLAAMENTGLVVRGRGEEFNWIGMHPRMANTFMSLLTNSIAAKRTGLRPVADFESNVVDTHIDSLGGLKNALLPAGDQIDPGDLRSVFVSACFEQVLPGRLEDLHIDQILKLRGKYPGELLKYQRAVDSLAESFAHMKGVGDLDRLEDDMAKKYDAVAGASLATLRKALGGAKKDAVIGSMSVSFAAPGLVPLLGALGFPALPVVAGIAGGALVLAGVLRNHEEAKEEALEACEYSWLYRAEKELKPLDSAKGLGRRLRFLSW